MTLEEFAVEAFDDMAADNSNEDATAQWNAAVTALRNDPKFMEYISRWIKVPFTWRIAKGDSSWFVYDSNKRESEAHNYEVIASGFETEQEAETWMKLFTWSSGASYARREALVSTKH